MFQIRSSILLLTSILVVSACGFKPVYSRPDGNKYSCNNFTVTSKNYEVVGSKMKYQLQDNLNQICINKDKKYRVELELDKGSEAVGIQKDREITRYNVVLATNYAIFEEGKTKPIYSGNKLVIGGYDAVASDYGTFSSEQDTFEKLAEETAAELSLSIAAKIRTEDK